MSLHVGVYHATALLCAVCIIPSLSMESTGPCDIFNEIIGALFRCFACAYKPLLNESLFAYSAMSIIQMIWEKYFGPSHCQLALRIQSLGPNLSPQNAL